MHAPLFLTAGFALGLACSAPAMAQSLVILDATGDDRGPGTYLYPLDPVYIPGSFDLTRFEMKIGDDYVDFAVTVNADLTNPWRQPHGFSLQFPIVFIGAAEEGLQDGLPGMNASFDFLGWDRAVLMSPLEASRVRREMESKAADIAHALVIPDRTSAEGRTITARVPRSELPATDPEQWAVQVVMQHNDGFASGGRLLMSAVNELQGQHRFGGGRDDDCDPNVIDMLTPQGQDQYALLRDYSCGPDNAPERLVVLPMILPGG